MDSNKLPLTHVSIGVRLLDDSVALADMYVVQWLVILATRAGEIY